MTVPAQSTDKRFLGVILPAPMAAELLRGVDPAMVPDLMTSLLRALKLSDVVLGVLQREIDDRLAWGFWPGEPDEKSA